MGFPIPQNEKCVINELVLKDLECYEKQEYEKIFW